ncbi:MAG: GLUG motif-containing protein [Spirochaetales bacterium]|nr:GLUG motif-containing protein [Spirochaetales bacterium]
MKKQKLFSSSVLLVVLLTLSCTMSGDYLDEISNKISSDENPYLTDGIFEQSIILTITEAGPDVISLTWTEPDDDDFSHVEISWSPGPDEPAVIEKGSNTFDLPAGGEGVVYEINGVAVALNGDSSEGSVISIRTPSYQRSVSCIYTAEELLAINDNTETLQGFYILRNDLSLSGYSSGEGWISIGSNTTPFYGVFDGNGHTISDMVINRTTQHVGFFGSAVSAYIENVTLESVDVTGQNQAGGLIGSTAAGTIVRNVEVSGSISGISEIGGIAGDFSEAFIYDSRSFVNVSGTDRVGAFFGKSQASTAESCSASGTVSGTSDLGGFGGLLDSLDIDNCTASVNVTGTGAQIGGFAGTLASSDLLEVAVDGNIQGDGNVGGFAGYITQTSLSRCSATGTATGSANYTGGFVGGLYDSQIVECWATGDVNGVNGVGGFAGNHEVTSSGAVTRAFATGNVSGSDSVGGFAGDSNTASYTDCFARGNVTGTNNYGGFVGNNNGSAFTRSYSAGNSGGNGFHGTYVATDSYTDCFHDSTTSGNTVSDEGTLPLTTLEMKNSSSFPTWDFTNTWTIDPSVNWGYPHLQGMAP